MRAGYTTRRHARRTCNVVRSLRGAIGAPHRDERGSARATRGARSARARGACSRAGAGERDQRCVDLAEQDRSLRSARRRSRFRSSTRSTCATTCVRRPVPTPKAVMFCLMDVSGSMDAGAQGPREALLHPALSVPDAQLRADRPRLHPPPHRGEGSRRAELLPLARDRRHRRVERARADGGDHRARATRRNDWNIYGGAGIATATTGTDDSPAAARLLNKSMLPLCSTSPTWRSRAASQQNLWQEYAAARRDDSRRLRDAQGRPSVGRYLSGVPRLFKKKVAAA